MCGFLFEVLGQVDDLDGFEWTFLHANTASNAQFFADPRDLRRRADLGSKQSKASSQDLNNSHDEGEEEEEEGQGKGERTKQQLKEKKDRSRSRSARRCLCLCLSLSLRSFVDPDRLVHPTSMHSFPILTTGHDFLHSCLHFFGLHRSLLTIAIRVRRSSGLESDAPLRVLPMLDEVR